jgi:hypothetical protein
MRLPYRQASPQAAREPNAERELVDAIVDAYVYWREAALAAEHAYRRWDSAAECDRPLAFRVYNTALDREEWAAECYACAIADYLAARRNPLARLRLARMSRKRPRRDR